MKRFLFILSVISFSSVAHGNILISGETVVQSKIDGDLVRILESGIKNVTIIVTFDKDTSSVLNYFSVTTFETRGDRISSLVKNLKSLTHSTQSGVVNLLTKLKTPLNFTQLWITNQLQVSGVTKDVIIALAQLPEVSRIEEEIVIRVGDPEFVEIQTNSPNAADELQWNLNIVGIPEAWALQGGNQGEGAVVANIDNGVYAAHEALRNNQRKEYGWFDPYYNTEESNSGPSNNAHGTHTMGTIAGGKGIGVAPKAKWINCKGLDDGSGTSTKLIQCGEFMLCPHHPNKTGANCDMAPDVVSCSWGSTASSSFYSGVVSAWKAARIIPVFSAGNNGHVSGCGSIGSHASIDVIAVGATGRNDSLAYFSSLGPTRNGVIKPDLAAPGHGVISAGNEGPTHYLSASGTSMATPLVAGVVGLMKAKRKDLGYEQIMQILRSTAVTKDLGDLEQSCGGIASTVFPNNHYGYGRINATAALEHVIQLPMPTTTEKNLSNNIHDAGIKLIIFICAGMLLGYHLKV